MKMKSKKFVNIDIYVGYFFIFVIFACVSYVAGKSFKIPIYRQRLTIESSSSSKILLKNILADHSSLKNNQISSNNQKWENDTIRLSKFMDGEYYGVIRIGNPAREFKMSFDTTWADSWVPSEHCGLWEIACMIHTKYDSSRSSTYQENGGPFKTGDTSSDIRGFISADSFNLAHLTIKNQSFAEITHMPWMPYGLTKADGIVGLAFPNLKTIPGPTFFNSMLKQGLIRKPVFTFYFNRDKTTERAGRLILGATDRKYVINETLTAVPVIEKYYWKIKMDKLLVFDRKHNRTIPFCKDSCEAILDTSTNTITGPTDEIDRINDAIGARSFVPEIFKMNRFMVSCREAGTLPPIEFVIAGTTFEIQSKYYIQHLVYESMEICLSPFVPNDQKFWQLGGAFLMEFYTEYDYNAAQVMIGRTIF